MLAEGRLHAGVKEAKLKDRINAARANLVNIRLRCAAINDSALINPTQTDLDRYRRKQYRREEQRLAGLEYDLSFLRHLAAVVKTHRPSDREKQELEGSFVL